MHRRHGDVRSTCQDDRVVRPSARLPVIWRLLGCALVLVAACGSPVVRDSPERLPSFNPPSPPATRASAPAAAATEQVAPGASPIASAPAVGFAFTADDLVAYYESAGHRCAAARPSTTADGFVVRTCELLDSAGRTRVVGFITEADGTLANAFASVQGAAGETFLAPIDALDPLAGFLGATLGADQGGALVEWLAGHLGDAFAQTAIGPIRVATYTASEDDHSTLYVELATQSYLDAASPGPSPS